VSKVSENVLTIELSFEVCLELRWNLTPLFDSCTLWRRLWNEF